MKLNNTGKVIVAVVACELAGVIGVWFIGSSITTWYAALTKPLLTPPNWVFGPVWTTLYFLMGISAFLVWRKGFERDDVKRALCLFASQLVLNVSWSVVFFGLHNIFFALAVIIVLWLVVYSTIRSFQKISRRSADLLIPYIIWLSFAAYLNFAFWLLNK